MPNRRSLRVEWSRACLIMPPLLRTRAIASGFAATSHFVRQTLANTLQGGASDCLGTSPTFCCGFTFFDCPHPAITFPAATVFLPRWLVRKQASGCTATLSIRITDRTVMGGAIEELESLERQILAAASSGQPLGLKQSRPLEVQSVDGAAEEFQAAVRMALAEIAEGGLNKVVLARSLDAVSSAPLSAIASLHNLRHRYPNCYVFALSNEAGQTFLGATPEGLIQVHQGRVVMDALAGSAPRGESAEIDAQLGTALFESEKDRHEHQVVVDAILGTLAKFGMSAAADAVPSLLKISNIQHLHTRICAQLPATVLPLELVAELHPTPAVAGFPKGSACDRIVEWESFQRGLYAAPIGWVSGDGDSEMAVAIRSALLEGDRAQLYAGAGIVAGSDPAREWAEVNLKLQALLPSLV